MGKEEAVGREIEELMRPGGTTCAAFVAALERMCAIGAGTYFREQFLCALQDKAAAMCGREIRA